jgi:type I restriction enzyme R subunit
VGTRQPSRLDTRLAKLPDLLALRYGALADARAELGDMARIRQGFIGFQRHLYEA